MTTPGPYEVRGPLLPQGSPPCVYQTENLSKAYATMIRIRQVVNQKNYHIYKYGRSTKVCRVCNTKISSNLSGCINHLNDYDVIQKIVKVNDFRGLDITKLKVVVETDHNDHVINCNCYELSSLPPNFDFNFNSHSNSNSNSNSYSSPITSIDDNTADEVVLYRSVKPDNKNLRSLIGTEIVLEGLIGIGKSTLGKSLGQYLMKNDLPVKFFPEFVDEHLLSLYISDTKKYAFPFQVIMARERLHIYDQARKFSSKGGISIIDRSLIGDLTFATMQRGKGFFTDEEWEVYIALVGFRHDEPMITVYLNGEPRVAYQRMLNRNMASEVSGYTVAYFEELNSAYTEILDEIDRNIDILHVPWGQDHEIMVDGCLSDTECRNFLTKVRDHLNK